MFRTLLRSFLVSEEEWWICWGKERILLHSSGGIQCYVENSDLLTEDLKFPNNNGCPNRARAQCEKRQAEHEKMAGRKEGKGKCSSGPFFLVFCVVVIVAFLLASWKQGNNEIYVVPT
jgi:hypothetical protein